MTTVLLVSGSLVLVSLLSRFRATARDAERFARRRVHVEPVSEKPSADHTSFPAEPLRNPIPTSNAASTANVHDGMGTERAAGAIPIDDDVELLAGTGSVTWDVTTAESWTGPAVSARSWSVAAALALGNRVPSEHVNAVRVMVHAGSPVT